MADAYQRLLDAGYVPIGGPRNPNIVRVNVGPNEFVEVDRAKLDQDLMQKRIKEGWDSRRIWQEQHDLQVRAGQLDESGVTEDEEPAKAESAGASESGPVREPESESELVPEPSSKPELPAAPKKVVKFDLGALGTLEMAYHDVLITDSSVVLIYDMQFEGGTRYAPPRETELTLFYDGNRYQVLPLDLVFTYGNVQFTILPITGG